MKINKETMGVIEQSIIEGNRLTLPNHLDRNLYVSVNKILESIGLKWNRKEKCHISEHNVEELVDSIINSGEWIDEKKLNQFYETPAEVIDKMIDLLDAEDGDTILEPSAGSGAILKKLAEKFSKLTMYYCEINTERIAQCAGLANFICSDFLEVTKDRFDGVLKIIMNPPFSKQQDITHLKHAISICQPTSKIVCVLSESAFFRTNKKTVEFWEYVRDKCEILETIELDHGAFKQSGTMVKTRIISLMVK